MIVAMIDIETLSLRPDAFVTQVGVVIGHRGTGQVLHQVCYTLDDRGQASRDKDFKTIQWWMRQQPDVVKSVFDPTITRTSGSAVFKLLRQDFERFVVEEVWASPAMFDLPVLTSLWGGSKPWKYNIERDMMTVYKLLDPKRELQPPDAAMGHNALADAQWQFQYLVALTDRLDRLHAA